MKLNKADELTQKGEKFALHNFETKDYQMVARRSYIEGALDEYKLNSANAESIAHEKESINEQKLAAEFERDEALKVLDQAKEEIAHLKSMLEAEKRHQIEAGEYRFNEFKKNVANRVSNWMTRHDAQLTDGEIADLTKLIQNS